MKKLLFAATASLLCVGSANAAVTSIPFLDGTGTTRQGAMSLDGSSILYPLGGLCGGTTATPGATITQCAIVNPSGQLLALSSQSGAWNITNITGTISLPTGAMPATGGTVGLVAGAAIIGKFGIDQTTPGATNGVQVLTALPAGAAILGKVGIDQTTPGTSNGVQLTAALPAGAATLGSVKLTDGTTQVGVDAATGGAKTALVACSPGICGLPTVTANALVQGRISTAMTVTTPTQLIALVASQRIYVTSVACKNTSTTPTLVNITDGNAGTVLAQLAAGATYGGDNLGGGSVPLFWTTAGNALYAVNVSTGASTTCNAAGYSSAN
jgi:hypothetical protein